MSYPPSIHKVSFKKVAKVKDIYMSIINTLQVIFDLMYNCLLLTNIQRGCKILIPLALRPLLYARYDIQ